MMKVIQTSGKRKTSIARASIKKGTGVIRVNSLNLQNYNPHYAKLRMQEPLLLGSKYADKVDIEVKVEGGGIMSQADAVRLAIATGLIKFSNDKKLEQEYEQYDRKMLVADVRRRERCKPNFSKARKSRQKSYR